ncbi:hypothetical protein Y919_00785 [Caloranaerobacter azorensis H53214]|uniref:Serine aminopeptidase S33 domain-containing protein n=1 Tax=Caloranaerobacter azorensis H53214 TaxID=1156417 RepID=A0A096BKD9_9FIRM|nr:alpha/beta hydrolase [Caloranaerobacter azorensis]KGG81322.1 hypothetical protein Y919_00785 [Caloranaerobacter azorensis H53214]
MGEKMFFSEKDLFMVSKDNHDSENRFSGKKRFIELPDGAKIDFWLLESENSKGNLIFFPPNGGNISFMVNLFHRLNSECSLNIYAFNYRGYGNSTGSPSIENILRDGGQVVEKVYSVADKSIPTILMGYSLGCFTCLNSYKSQEIDDWIKGYVCISAFSGIEDLAMVFGATGNNVVIDPNLKRLDNQKSVSKIDLPILFIHGAQDNFIPKFMSEKLYKICPSRNKKLLLIENAGHNDIFKDNKLDKIINEIKLMIKNIER